MSRLIACSRSRKPIRRGNSAATTVPAVAGTPVWIDCHQCQAPKTAPKPLRKTPTTALALWHPAPASYRPRNDAALVQHLNAASQPADWIMLSFSAGYLAAFYGKWDARTVPYETDIGYVGTIVRNRVLHLPLRLDYGNPSREAAADAEHRRVVSDFLQEERPARVWFLGYHVRTYDDRSWAPNVMDVLTDHGYRVDRVGLASRSVLYVGVAPWWR